MEVVCALFEEPSGKLFAARRAVHKPHAGIWEFPGGKVEKGELLSEAIQREIMEELGVSIQASQTFYKVVVKNRNEIEKAAFVLHAFLIKLPSNIDFILSDHDKGLWLEPKEWLHYSFHQSDREILNFYLNQIA